MDTDDLDQPFYTVKALALRWRVSEGTVYDLVAAGTLRAKRVGTGRGTIRVSREAVRAYELPDALPARPAPAGRRRQPAEHFAFMTRRRPLLA